MSVPVRLVKPVRSGPIMTERQMNEEEVRDWEKTVNEVMTPALDAAFAADQAEIIVEGTTRALDALEQYVGAGYKQHTQQHGTEVSNADQVQIAATPVRDDSCGAEG